MKNVKKIIPYLFGIGVLTMLATLIYAIAPTHTAPILNSTLGTNFTDENLFCFNQSSSDAEGDYVVSNYRFYQDTISNSTRVIDDDSLILWMPMDENRTDWVIDYSGEENNGTITGATFTNSGKQGGAYFFDGTNYITINNDDTLNLSEKNFTISLWVNISDSSHPEDTILDKGGDYTINYIKTGTQFKFVFFTTSLVASTERFTSPMYNFNEWIFVTFTRNTTNTSAYINGVFVNSTTITDVRGTTEDLIIGATPPAPAFFNGTIDEVKIYNKRLSQEEINQLYIGGKNALGIYNSSDTKIGQDYICEVTPYGIEKGTPLNSSPLTILDFELPKPITTKLSLSKEIKIALGKNSVLKIWK